MKLSKKGQPLAKCARPSFSENTVNTKYNSRYRNSENTNRLGGKLLKLGRATGIVAMALYGFDVSLEAASTNERERIFRLAAWYALADEDVEEIFSHDRVHVDDCIKGIVTTGIRLYKYEAAEEVHKVFQNMRSLLRWSRTPFFKCILLLNLANVSSPSKPPSSSNGMFALLRLLEIT